MSSETSGQISAVMDTADYVVDAVGAACLLVSGLAALVLLILGTADVLGTQFLGRSLPSAIELQESFAAILIFTGIVVAQRYRAHIAVDLLTGRLDGKAKLTADVFSLALTIVVFVVLSTQTYELATRSLRAGEHSPGYLGFPLYPFKIVAFMACCIATIEALRQLAHVLRGESRSMEAQFDQNELIP